MAGRKESRFVDIKDFPFFTHYPQQKDQLRTLNCWRVPQSN
eukprot:CAMPEP_0177590584 /NCGR_PEP_ID=MMETSP0419_2-20121207/7495_1 /TAXON_ID=582737 /ORGANISM="Tetraselmis sp., Strain GSL018" /LENGTH=40 /DNA_ID= /DNA_START= /DNA_END= /DNA_ORIENTATION=